MLQLTEEQHDIYAVEADVFSVEQFAHKQAERRAGEVIERARGSGVESTEQPVGLNPISSSLNYLAHLDEYGPEHEKTREAYSYLRDDARTALFEALIERGHISTTTSTWNPETWSFESGNLSIMDVLENGLDDRLIKAEHDRRVAEVHEEALVESLFNSGLFSEGIALLTFSPFPENLPDETAASLGYKPSTKKYMIRWITVDDDGERTTKQLSMSSSDSATITEFLRQKNYYDGDEDLSPLEILNKPIMVSEGELNGLEDVAEQLDGLTQNDVFLGGEPNGDTYEELDQLSQIREMKLKAQIDVYTQSLVDIAAEHAYGYLSLKESQDKYIEATQEAREQIARVEPEMVRETIGDESADKYVQAQWLEAQGDYASAQIMIESAGAAMEEAIICGMRVRIDAEGNTVNENGEAEAKCEKLPERGKCPSCGNNVKIDQSGSLPKCTYPKVLKKTGKPCSLVSSSTRSAIMKAEKARKEETKAKQEDAADKLAV